MAWSPGYCTVEELQALTGSDAEEHEVLMGLAIEAASRAVDQATNRQFGKVAQAEARTYTARYDKRQGHWFIEIDDLMSVTNLAVAYDDNGDQVYDRSITDYRLAPFNAASEGRPWTKLIVRSSSAVQPTSADGAVQVTALWGWTAVPDTVKQATLIQAHRFFMRRDAAFGVAGSPDLGNELRLLSKLDPDVAVMLTRYVRWWGAA